MSMLHLFNCDTPGMSSQPHPEGDPGMHMYQMRCFCSFETVSIPTAGVSSCSRLRGTHEGRGYTRRKVGLWPVSVTRACSGCSKARELASNHGIAFRRARASQENGNPTV